MYSETVEETEILKYLPLVEKVVSQLNIKRADYDREDLINIGVIGLMDALKKYDRSKKVPFEGYAYIRIKGTIIDEVRKTSKVSRSKMAKLNDFYKAKEELEKTLMRTPSEGEICEKLDINDKQLGKIHETIHQLASLSLEHVLFKEENTEIKLIDKIEDTNIQQTDTALLGKEQVALLTEAIKTLDKREQMILNFYYVDEMPLKEIAYILELSIPRISQIHGKIILKLKQYFKEVYHD